MKPLKDGGLAFYPARSGYIFAAVVFAAVGLFAFNAFSLKEAGNCLFLLLWAGFWFALFIPIFFPKPVCVLYPEKIEWSRPAFIRARKERLFWADAAGFFLKEEWIKQGKNSFLANVLVLTARSGVQTAPVTIKHFFRLSKQNQLCLLQELQSRGLTRLPDVKDEKTPAFIKKLCSKFHS